MTKLSLIIPAYNEDSPERNFKQTLGEYHYILNKLFGNDFEMIIIPNNCSDDTVKIVQDFVFDRHQTSYYNIKGYSGKGGAVMKGFEIAQGEYIGFVDSDNSTTVYEFIRCYNQITKPSYNGGGVIGSRTKHRNYTGFIFHLIVELLFDFRIKDTQCGCKIFTKDCVKMLVENYTETGWMFDIDLIYLCHRHEYYVKEVPIIWNDTINGKVKFWSGVTEVLKLIKYRIIKFVR